MKEMEEIIYKGKRYEVICLAAEMLDVLSGDLLIRELTEQKPKSLEKVKTDEEWATYIGMGSSYYEKFLRTTEMTNAKIAEALAAQGRK